MRDIDLTSVVIRAFLWFRGHRKACTGWYVSFPLNHSSIVQRQYIVPEYFATPSLLEIMSETRTRAHSAPQRDRPTHGIGNESVDSNPSPRIDSPVSDDTMVSNPGPRSYADVLRYALRRWSNPYHPGMPGTRLRSSAVSAGIQGTLI